jgi:hypothetical protein
MYECSGYILIEHRPKPGSRCQIPDKPDASLYRSRYRAYPEGFQGMVLALRSTLQRDPYTEQGVNKLVHWVSTATAK